MKTVTPTSIGTVVKLPSCVIPLSEPHLLFKENCHSFSMSEKLSVTFAGPKEAKKPENCKAFKYFCSAKVYIFCTKLFILSIQVQISPFTHGCH